MVNISGFLLFALPKQSTIVLGTHQLHCITQKDGLSTKQEVQPKTNKSFYLPSQT
jgi:hypothetical protein